MRFRWQLVIYAVVLCMAIEEVNGAGGPTPDPTAATSEASGPAQSGKKRNRLLGKILHPFKQKTKCCDLNEDMTGKTAFVTGANRGLGFETTKQLVQKKARVIMACRNTTACFEAKSKILQQIVGGNADANVHAEVAVRIICVHLDLESFEAIREAIRVFQLTFPTITQIDVLIHNAAMVKAFVAKKNYEGREVIMMVNYFGLWLLTHLLIEKLRESARQNGNPCIVIVSSNYHVRATGNVQTLGVSSLLAFNNYYNSKRAGLLFGMELAERLEADGIRVLMIFPGAAKTGIYDVYPVISPFIKMTTDSPASRAENIVCMATDPKYTISGAYYEICDPKPLTEYRKPVYNLDIAKQLWENTAHIVQLLPGEPIIPLRSVQSTVNGGGSQSGS